MSIIAKLRDLMRRFFGRYKGARSPIHLAQRQVMSARGNSALPSLAQWRELPRYFSPAERRIFTVAIAGILIAIGILGYRFFSTNQTAIPTIGGEYTEGLIGTPQYLNPLYAVASDTDSDLSRLIFSGLMRWDSENGLIPDLAESYTVSEDQKTYTFSLRPDAVWHDKTPITATDVVFTFQAIQNPDYRSPLAISLGGTGVAATDERTVVFTLAEPFAPFLSTLTIGILPSHVWGNILPSSAQLAQPNLKPIGSGPYKFEKFTKDQRGVIRSMNLVRNDNFYRTGPYIERFIFNFYSDAAELANALRNKNVQGASYLSYDEARAIAQDRSLQILRPTLPQFTAAFLNDRHSTILADDNVRQALAVATDTQSIVQTVLGGEGKPISSPILPSMPGYDETIGGVLFDQAAAIALLEKSNWKLSEGSSVRTKGESALALTLTTVNTPELIAAAEELKTMWNSIGFEITVITISPSELQNDTLKNRNYDILLTGMLYGVDRDPYAFWHSSQTAYPGLNVAQFASRKVDDAIVAARSTNDPEVLNASYRIVAEVIAAEFPAVFLYQPTYTYVTTSKIKQINLPAITTPADRFSTVNEWYMRTRNVFQSGGNEETVR